ncbi:protein FAR1-RELATED SEQUENCE 4-like [Lotus japonicus]|uniref:protein FAR1-RELATED SEQUENCE 4-like n=1 Tax=Lotus japonicus TaxID=34305 RepID=UPI00258F3D5C|nr:protein FAR1-RELATED SEQUENCE 4-like [Lotus japonicus]
MQSGGLGNSIPDKGCLYNQISRQNRKKKNDGVSAIQFMRDLLSKDGNMYVDCLRDDKNIIDRLFWCDDISKLSHELFGDVLAFDATYKKNQYMLPLVVFSGVNNHNRSTIFAAALISNETKETYVWLLEQLMVAMKGKQPSAVITDGCAAMKYAIKTVLPDARHRLCAWHILINAGRNAKNKLFNKAFKNLMYDDYTMGKFKRKWDETVAKFGFQDKKWVKDMYDKRKMWATTYLRGKFFAGFRTTSRCEGLHFELGKYVHSRYNLRDFLDQYHICLNFMRFRELKDDCESIHGEAVPVTNLKKPE